MQAAIQPQDLHGLRYCRSIKRSIGFKYIHLTCSHFQCPAESGRLIAEFGNPNTWTIQFLDANRNAVCSQELPASNRFYQYESAEIVFFAKGGISTTGAVTECSIPQCIIKFTTRKTTPEYKVDELLFAMGCPKVEKSSMVYLVDRHVRKEGSEEDDSDWDGWEDPLKVKR